MPQAPTSQNTSRLDETAKQLGCPELLHLSGDPTARHLDYLDLLPRRTEAPLLPRAVAEFQGQPLLYLLDGDDEAGKSQDSTARIHDLQQLLANRSEHACLGVVRPGQLEVYPINLDRKALEKVPPKVVLVADPAAPVFFQSLATGAYPLEGQPKAADYVFDEIHHLLSEASKALTGQLQPLEVLSITGRALFFRFLTDRRIVQSSELPEICLKAEELKDVFSNADKAAATSCWLDETFNGDLLPLVPSLPDTANAAARLKAYREFYRQAGASTSERVFRYMEAMLRGWRAVGTGEFQLRFNVDWNELDFAHIPIGVLSQVYETFSRQWDEEHAERTSVYYTPKRIAHLLVEEALAGLDDPAEAHILDPACGGGIFLVLAFRHLVRKRWEKDEKRPDTRAIHRILYGQIRGFDVSESALRLAALALYITAIEVNGSPRPPRSLKFPRPLKSQVLFGFGQNDPGRKRGFVLGSLGPEVPGSLNGSFEVVVSNPPWTRLRASAEHENERAEEKARNDAINREFTAITKRALLARGLSELANSYRNPDNNPDLPFLWRATEWTKPNGVIAMALPGRVILKQSDRGKAAREAILRGLKITGIINGSDLEETPVWPNMKLPFVLLFARNTVPGPDHRFHFATPFREDRLASRGRFRLDYQAAEAVSTADAVRKPWLLKTLAVGTVLDAEIEESLYSLGWTELGDLWTAKSRFYSGLGYNLSPALDQCPAPHLRDLLDFEPPESGFAIDYGQLTQWGEKHSDGTAHMPRNRRLYDKPLLIVPQTPGEGREQPKSYRSLSRSLAFSQSYYGFSAAGYGDGDVAVSLLYLVTHSLLFSHFCLVRSSRIGASWRTIIKDDLDAFPFPEPAALTSSQKRRILEIASALEDRREKPWSDLDKLVFDLYGLDEHDAVVVRDTVAYAAPYQSRRAPAEAPPRKEDTVIFRDYLEEMLQPYFEVAGERANVRVLDKPAEIWDAPWRFLTVTLASDRPPTPSALLCRLMNEANRTAASRLIMKIPGSGLLIGLLNQQRFWTRSRARLCGVHLIRDWLDAFPLAAHA